MHAIRTFGPAFCAALLSGLVAQIPDFKPSTPILDAALKNDSKAMSSLLAAGADPNEGRFFGSTALQIAAIHGNHVMANDLLAHGADPAATDSTGNSALMWTVGGEQPNPTLRDQLLSRGVDPNRKNKWGESALTWAYRRADLESIARLKSAGANEGLLIREAVEKAIGLLQKSGTQFTKASGCASCHHQSLPQMLNGMARRRGYAVDEPAAGQQVKAVIAMFRPIRAQLEDGSAALPNPGISISYSLLGIAAEGYAPDETTAAMATAILRTQRADGSFAILPARPPLEASPFTSTALSLRALQLYGSNAGAAIAQARKWLSRATPSTNEERSMRLLGLTWANAGRDEVNAAAKDLLSTQRPDGGWGQLDRLESDAYATGQALTALQLAGVDSPALRQGVAALVRSQLADGSWLVRSRSNPVQPMKDSGFPHGRDQWISAAGSSWAAMALTLTQPAAATSASENR